MKIFKRILDGLLVLKSEKVARAVNFINGICEKAEDRMTYLMKRERNQFVIKLITRVVSAVSVVTTLYAIFF
jgi:hypothetical protein